MGVKVYAAVRYLSAMKTAFLRFALLGLLAAGCSKGSDPTPTPPAPAPDDVIALRVTGSNLNGLGARLQVQGAAGDDGKPTYVQASLAKDEYYATSVSKTIAVATVPHYRAGGKRYDFTATVSFSSSGPAAGQLRAEWLVNGQVSTATSRPPTVQISGSSPTSAYAYLSTNAL